MRVGIIQPNYLPWRGYFDFIDNVDLFIVFDDVQFTRRDWRTRNSIKTPVGLQWLSVPVRYQARGALINQMEIDDSQGWRGLHRRALDVNYARAPFVEDARDLLSEILAGAESGLLQLNLRGMKCICRYLGISTPMILASELAVDGQKTERLVRLLRKVGATEYLSGGRASAYLELQAFAEAGIDVAYKAYDYPPYPQSWGEFQGAVSILDLIANCGPQSRQYIGSLSPDRSVVAGGVVTVSPSESNV